MNCDGFADGFDIQAFILAMQNPASYAVTYPNCIATNGDFDSNAIVSFADLPMFVQYLLNE